MSKRAAAVQAGGWSQEQSGDLKEAGKLWECLLAGIAWMGLKNKVQSVSQGWILLGSSVEASACSYTILKEKNWVLFVVVCLFYACLLNWKDMVLVSLNSGYMILSEWSWQILNKTAYLCQGWKFP